MPTPEVEVKVNIVPARRTASYAVSLNERKVDDLVTKVNAKSVILTGGVGQYRTGQPVELPKTLAAVDALIALAQAVRAELVEQGIEE